VPWDDENVQPHPLALLLPEMSDEEFDALTASIRDHGQLVPAHAHRGLLLDGRHRAWACRQLGIDLQIAEFDGDDDDARAFVLASNVHRRHLSTSQRAIAAAALALRSPGRPKTGTGAALTQAAAAATVQVGERTLRDARVVLRDEALTEQVVSGSLSVKRAAAILREELTSAERSRLVHAVRRESASDEWYTPPHIVERAIRALGGHIDLDPCADEGRSVPAARHITAQDDALSETPWAPPGARLRAFMNPPYGSGSGPFVRRLLREYEAGAVGQAILLLPARLGSEWMAALGEWPRVELTGRLSFVAGPTNPAHGRPPTPAQFSSVVVGVGLSPEALYEAFGDLGHVMVRWRITS